MIVEREMLLSSRRKNYIGCSVHWRGTCCTIVGLIVITIVNPGLMHSVTLIARQTVVK